METIDCKNKVIQMIKPNGNIEKEEEKPLAHLNVNNRIIF